MRLSGITINFLSKVLEFMKKWNHGVFEQRNENITSPIFFRLEMILLF